MSAPTQAAPAASPTPESHLSHFQFERILNQGVSSPPNPSQLSWLTCLLLDQPARRIILLGHIPCPGDSSTTSHQALLLVEHAPHPTSAESFATFAASLSNLQTLSHNDIYSWFLASSPIPSLKLTLISPCTPAHIAKYTPQRPRIVHETPAIYAQHVRPWIADKGREGKKLAWIENALSGRAEADKVLYREEGEDGFNIMPDLNWDTKTKESMHLLVLVEKGRKGLWSLRDLGKGDGKWLRHVRESIVRVVVGGSVVVGVEEDEIRCYVHCMSCLVLSEGQLGANLGSRSSNILSLPYPCCTCRA